jgi:hypothetical protein
VVFARIVIVLLSVAIGGGPTLLDACLISCHVDEQTIPSEGHCHHAAPSPSASAWQATSTCHHDHNGRAAEMVLQPNQPSPVKDAAVALAPVLIDTIDVPRIVRSAVSDLSDASSLPSAFASPLRV